METNTTTPSNLPEDLQLEIQSVRAENIAALARIAELEVERDELKRIASAYSPQKELSTALEQAKASGRQADLRARLAEIETQEPVAKIHTDGYWTARRGHDPLSGGKAFLSVYARPVPAQAVPMSDERIDAIADLVIKGMPDGIHGFMRTWDYQQFARALLEVCAGHYRAQAVPDGWRLVPLEITEAMHVAAVKTIVRCSGNDEFPPRVWAAMIAAAQEAAR